ncbi:transposable element Tc1 transposase [Trichonephila clavipes]|nr:transposable element Tc1 transposase [Trichonephila clavipes]
MLDARTPLHVFEKNSVTGVRYRDKVLEPYVGLFRDAGGLKFILMDNNARPHRAFLVDEFLERGPAPFDPRTGTSPWTGGCGSLLLSMSGTLWEGQLQLSTPFREPSRNENSVAERGAPIVPQELINCLISSMTSHC